ncbi:MipA/OmpV family protein [Paraburkholderia sp. A1RI_3L]|uniref:MipA/OmpV family protein n=1 Tax=Paraburkholderia TaxID=1822464 RepID=UPI003B8158EF
MHKRTTAAAASVIATLAAAVATPASAQTPSPLAEWQYTAGIPLEKLMQPSLPTWRIRVGPAASFRPLYDGSDRYHMVAGPSIDIRYRDLFFLSTGEGIGMNVLSGPNWRVSLGAAYDLGRRARDDSSRLGGMDNINPAPAVKLAGEYVISKSFPLVLRADVRRYFGGSNGWVADLGAYMPMPGSSRKFVWFAGPGVTFADSRYMNSWFGVTPNEAARSGHPTYRAGAGVKSFGFGVSATWIINKHWLASGDAAIQQLVGDAVHSPITQRATGTVLDMTVTYQF